MMRGNNSNIDMAQHNELIYLSAKPGRVGSTDIYVEIGIVFAKVFTDAWSAAVVRVKQYRPQTIWKKI